MSNVTDKGIRRWEMTRYNFIFLSIIGTLIVFSLKKNLGQYEEDCTSAILLQYFKVNEENEKF